MKKLSFYIIFTLILLGCTDGTSNKKNQDENKIETAADDIVRTPLAMVSDSIALDSANARLYIERAQMFIQEERISMAIRDINKALSIDNKNVDALLVLADIYYALGDQDNILLTLNKATEVAPFDSRPVVKLAELSFLQGNQQLCMAYLDKAFELSSFNPQAYFLRGMVYLSKNDTIKAMKNFMNSRHQDESLYDPLIQIASIYAAQGNPIAVDYYKKAIADFPENHGTYYDLAMYLQDNGEPEEALSYYDTLIAKYPDNSQFVYNKGYVYLVYLSEYDKALDCFDKALELNPTYVDALYNKGRTLEQMGRYKDAKSIYLQILRNVPNYQMAIDAIHRMGD